MEHNIFVWAAGILALSGSIFIIVGWGPANMIETFGLWTIQIGNWLGETLISMGAGLRKSQALREERNRERLERMRIKSYDRGERNDGVVLEHANLAQP